MTDTNLQDKEDIKINEPKMFNVIMYNDDYTSMEFVIEVMMRIFQKTSEEAMFLTSAIHSAGKGVVGTYTKEIAETKAHSAEDMAAQQEYPLRVEVISE